MDIQTLIAQLHEAEKFFSRSTAALEEEHSQFRPTDDCMTSAQQVAHVAHTVDWFFEGAFRPEGFDMDFAAHGKMLETMTSLAAARKEFSAAFERARAFLQEKTREEIMAPIVEGPIMGGALRIVIISAIEDHTAHHRGALTVYARLNGLVPPMPYM